MTSADAKHSKYLTRIALENACPYRSHTLQTYDGLSADLRCLTRICAIVTILRSNVADALQRPNGITLTFELFRDEYILLTVVSTIVNRYSSKSSVRNQLTISQFLDQKSRITNVLIIRGKSVIDPWKVINVLICLVFN